MRVPALPRRRTGAGSVWAVGLAKNEADILGHTLRHLLDQGVAGVIIADNLSEDGTGEVIRQAALDPRVHAGEDRERAFYQGRKTSYLAHLAWRAGADWVIPFDADEHWYAEGCSLGDFFRDADADVVRCSSRAAYPVNVEDSLALGTGAAVQVQRLALGITKVAFRARRWVRVGEGNHTVDIRDPRRIDGLHLLHYQYRSLDQLVRKVTSGTAGLDAAGGLDEDVGLHWREQARLTRREQEARWRAFVAGELDDEGSTTRSGRVVVTDPTTWPWWDPDGVIGPG